MIKKITISVLLVILLLPIVTHAETNVSFTVNTSQRTEINKGIVGFNAPFVFGKQLDKRPEFTSLGQELSPTLLRFPGGTLANYYHPTGVGYGIKKNEVKGWGVIRSAYNDQKKETVNALYNYIDHAKKIGNKTLVVANVLYGTPEETLFVIKELKSAGLEIAGVELGNELYFGEYRKKFPNVETYIKKVKPFAEAIRANYPDLKIGVIAAKTTGEAGGSVGSASFANSWVQELSKETFYDAYIVHGYIDDGACNRLLGKSFDQTFDCVNTTTDVININYAKKLEENMQGAFSGKEMWYTEWNIKSPQNTAGNTLAHAFYITESLMNFNDYNKNNNNKLTYATYHNYLSEGYGYGTIVYDRNKNTFNKTAAFYVFDQFNTLIKNGAKNISSSINTSSTVNTKKFNSQFYYNSDGTLTMVYTNKTGGDVRVDNITGYGEKKGTMSYIVGEKPYARFGWTGFTKKYPKNLLNVEQKTEPFNGVIKGPYSTGSIQFSR